jgi:hypothetical protein
LLCRLRSPLTIPAGLLRLRGREVTQGAVTHGSVVVAPGLDSTSADSGGRTPTGSRPAAPSCASTAAEWVQLEKSARLEQWTTEPRTTRVGKADAHPVCSSPPRPCWADPWRAKLRPRLARRERGDAAPGKGPEIMLRTAFSEVADPIKSLGSSCSSVLRSGAAGHRPGRGACHRGGLRRHGRRRPSASPVGRERRWAGAAKVDLERD